MTGVDFDNFKTKKKRVTNSPKLPLQLKVKVYELNYDLLLTAVNNFLKGYKSAYERQKGKPFDETVKKYNNMLKEREKLLKLIEMEELK